MQDNQLSMFFLSPHHIAFTLLTVIN
uniref:Uncharacterized protein n=1 Tax=Anguilla anguilla TaxID=7936 RepID=A0A0E9VIY9_ANGAN